ncbi:ABC transporter permease [Paenibacillus mesophilus]|nr:ABC transporter permease [Paenibacillus mesophilus]
MSNMVNLIQNENMKIYRRPRTWVMAALLLAVTITFAVLMKSFGPDGSISALTYMSNVSSLTMLVFIFSVVIAADIVAGEFTWGTIKLLLIRPVGRSKVLLSKYIAVLLFMLALLALLFVSSLVIGFLLFGTAGNKDIPLTMGGVLREYGFRLVELTINVTFAFMISTVFRSSALAISLAFVIMFASSSVMTILIALKKEWAKYILFANTDLGMYFGSRKPPFEGMTLGFSITMLILYYAVFIALAWTIFRKRDVAG